MRNVVISTIWIFNLVSSTAFNPFVEFNEQKVRYCQTYTIHVFKLVIRSELKKKFTYKISVDFSTSGKYIKKKSKLLQDWES